jgi:hypothetical protein
MADTGVARPNGPGWAQEGRGEADRQSIATAEGAAAYREHFTRTVLPELQCIDGYQGAYLLRRDHDTHVRLQVLPLWDALEAIRTSAGANLENAVVELPPRRHSSATTAPSPTTSSSSTDRRQLPRW